MPLPSPQVLVRRLDGHDGSHWQADAGPINLSLLRQSTFWLAWKATQSTKYLDPTFNRIRVQAREEQFKHFFPYHWLSSTTSVRDQALHFLDKTMPLRTGEGAMLDAEEAGITVDKVVEWCTYVESHIKRPCSVYTGLYVAPDAFGRGTIWRDPRVRLSAFGLRPMHLAAYVSPTNLYDRMRAAGVLTLPLHAWQYSSNGPVPGITGRADMNTIMDISAFDLAAGIVHQQPPIIALPSEEVMPIITNATASDRFGDPLQSKWVLMDDGSKRHIGLPEWVARGALVGTPLNDGELDALPNYVAPSANSGLPANVRVVGTIEAHTVQL